MAGGPGLDPEAARIGAVIARHERELLGYPNVVALAAGERVRAGQGTGERCIVVHVVKKVPESELPPDGVLPSTVDGVPVDVRESGQIEALGH